MEPGDILRHAQQHVRSEAAIRPGLVEADAIGPGACVGRVWLGMSLLIGSCCRHAAKPTPDGPARGVTAGSAFRGGDWARRGRVGDAPRRATVTTIVPARSCRVAEERLQTAAGSLIPGP